jgi:Ca2+-binding RTX toxin-like protein
VEFSIRLGNGAAADIKAEAYTGPVAGIEYQIIAGASNDIIMGSDRADYINAGVGDDAIDGGAGNDVIDGGLGSNFVTGGAGMDKFFVDGGSASTTTTWSTITDFTAGEQVTIWGYQPGVSKFLWVASDGADGYKGATMHCDLDGNGVIDTSLTFSGLTQAELPAPTYGSIEGEHFIVFG